MDVNVTEEGKDTFRCEYVAPEEGEYRVDVKFDGSPVPGSPFPVEVAKPGDAGKCKAQGDGLETAIIDQLAEFDVDCKSAGEFSIEERKHRHVLRPKKTSSSVVVIQLKFLRRKSFIHGHCYFVLMSIHC